MHLFEKMVEGHTVYETNKNIEEQTVTLRQSDPINHCCAIAPLSRTQQQCVPTVFLNKR